MVCGDGTFAHIFLFISRHNWFVLYGVGGGCWDDFKKKLFDLTSIFLLKESWGIFTNPPPPPNWENHFPYKNNAVIFSLGIPLEI